VQLLDGVLRVRLNDQPRLPVFPLAGQADRFAYDVVAAELQFERQADGTGAGAGAVPGRPPHQRAAGRMTAGRRAPARRHRPNG
jgi:hypothetical protein